MKVFNKIKGNIGEFNACQYLKNKKYKIIETNYRNNIGEIDIIAMKDKCLVFVEVKSRQTCQFGRPSEAVDRRKQRKIVLTAESFLKNSKLNYDGCRFDVIEVVDNEINHIENAFYS